MPPGGRPTTRHGQIYLLDNPLLVRLQPEDLKLRFLLAPGTTPD
jgi:hypothetical protein